MMSHPLEIRDILIEHGMKETKIPNGYRYTFDNKPKGYKIKNTIGKPLKVIYKENKE